MEGQIRGRVAEREATVADTLFALRQLDALGTAESLVLAYHPIARVNPYQALLYRRCWEHGIAPVPLANLDWLPDLEVLASRGSRVALHLHWTKGVLGGAQTIADAQARHRSFVERIDRFIDKGGALVWTVHNILPHDCEFPDEEARLQQSIADRAAVIHVMTPTTDRAVERWFSIAPHKLFVVAHPSYRGAYPDIVTRDEARYELGFDPDELVYGMFGAIRPYKGLLELLDAFDRALEEPGRRRLLVAGAPSGLPGEQELLDRCAVHPFVTLVAERIPNHEMQIYLRAADVAVFPYQRSLNSGVLMLALTFGLPAIVPADTELAAIVDDRAAITFVPGSADSLAGSLVAADGLRTARARSAVARIVERRDPDVIAHEFARGIAERLAGGGGSATRERQPPTRSRATATKV